MFKGDERCAGGHRSDVTEVYRRAREADPTAEFNAFDLVTGQVVDLDLRSTSAASDESSAPRRGRPRLGVIAREVTLLPRHWEWLATRPGGASATLRRLIEEARKADKDQDAGRRAAEAAYRFMLTMAGDRPGFEEASRALFAGDYAKLESIVDGWPTDIRDQISQLLNEQPIVHWTPENGRTGLPDPAAD